MNTLHGCLIGRDSIDLIEEYEGAIITESIIAEYCGDYDYLEIQDRSATEVNDDVEYDVIDSWSKNI